MAAHQQDQTNTSHHQIVRNGQPDATPLGAHHYSGPQMDINSRGGRLAPEATNEQQPQLVKKQPDLEKLKLQEKQFHHHHNNNNNNNNNKTPPPNDHQHADQQQQQQQQTTSAHLHANEDKNLDSGYAWVILLIMFLIQSSISGASRIYGIVYAKEVSIGYYDREQASWPIASSSAIENFASILTPALAYQLSWRQIELLSTCLFIIANLLAYFSDSLWLDIVALGCIQGLALSTSTPLALAINNDYFERYRTTACGISMSGSTFGVLYLTPIVAWLLENYTNFRLVYLALALVFCLNLVLVLFIKPRAETIGLHQAPPEGMAPPTTIKPPPNCIAGAEVSDESAPGARRLSRFESHFERKNSIASISYRVRSCRQSVFSLTSGGGGTNLARPSRKSSSTKSDADNSTGARPRRVASQRDANLSMVASQLANASKMLAKSSSSGAKLFNLGQQPSDTTTTTTPQVDHQKAVEAPNDQGVGLNFAAAANGRGEVEVSTQFDQQQQQQQQKKDEAAINKREISKIKFSKDVDGHDRWRAEDDNCATCHAINCSLGDDHNSANYQQQQQEQQQLVNANSEYSIAQMRALICVPYLHCTWIMLALYYIIARIFIIILVDFADDHGFSLSESTSLLNYWSVGELMGRIFLGSLIDLQCMSCKSCISLTCILLSASIVSMVTYESYYVYAASSFLIAALISLEYMLINVLIVEYLGKKSVTSCYSLAACISSLVLFARPTLIGLFRDQLGSYDGLLLLMAALSFAYGTLFYLLEPLLVRYWPKEGQLKHQK